MTPFELKASLESMTLLVDSREQPTENWKRRIELSGLGHERRKLEFGDYSCKCHPQALVASIHAYRARYGMQLDFCKAELTGKLIREILFRELKEVLENEY